MKTFFVVLLVATISLVGLLRETKTDVQAPIKKVLSPATGTKINFVPFSWQTKWFDRDLNSRVHVNGMEGC